MDRAAPSNHGQPRASANDVGALLREWRMVRRLSQLDLALCSFCYSSCCSNPATSPRTQRSIIRPPSEEALKDVLEKIDFQADYVRELCAATDYPKFDIDLMVAAFKEWAHDRQDSIVGYRNKAFKSPCTGTMAPVHHTPWLEAMDDSMETFLAVKQAAAE